jgi:hypothetical protein
MKKQILSWYKQGFNDELLGDVNTTVFKDSLLYRAYNIGRLDAKLGDDVSSLDMRSDKEIVKFILQDKTLFV